MALNITLGNILMDGSTVDPDGCIWACTALDGWDAAPNRLTFVEYTMKHGSAPANPTYGPRPLTMKGVCKTPNEAGFWKAYNGLLQLLNTGVTPISLSVSEAGVVKTLSVIRATEPRLPISPGHFDFQIGLTAPDPLKYGAAVTTTIAAGASKNITHAGSIETFNLLTTLTANGMMSLTNTTNGTRLFSRVSMDSGTVLNNLRRTVTKSGSNRYGQMGRGSMWWPLEVGANTIQNGGSAGVSITYRPAWS